MSKIKNVTHYAVYLLLVWGFYRLFFKLPETIEELVLKPIIWLIPLIFLLAREKENLSSIGITSKNLFKSIYMVIGLGAIFAVVALITNYLKYQQFKFGANLGSDLFGMSLFLSLATAVSEEVAFRGYLFNRVWQIWKNEWLANLTVSLVWGIIHLPVAVFIWKLDSLALFSYLLVTFLFGVGSSFIFARTKNVFSSILLHVLWEWPIILFR